MLSEGITRSFKVMFHNVNGIKHCIKDMKTNPEVLTSHVVGIEETKLERNDELENVPGFTFVRCDRNLAIGGGDGVGIFVKEELVTKRLSLPVTHIEAIAVEVQNPPITVCVVYCPPQTTKQHLELDMQTIIQNIPGELDTIIGGDFNV